ncbi:MAG: hypothetical protein LLG97_14560 [Deltaproteobacteria bacterium]|nr:hypothetical protein [Deltaproteobacteria bacterium]
MRQDYYRNQAMAGFVSLFLALVFLILLSVPNVQAAIWYVRQEAVSGGNGQSWHEAFNNIQSAINAANSSDQIFVKKGTYILSSTLTIIDKGPDIYGGFNGTTDETSPEHARPAANPTIIDGGNSVRCVRISVGIAAFEAPIINGFTIRNGWADDTGTLSDYGGGVYIVGDNRILRPVFNNCIFTNNYADRGGGAVALSYVDADFINCTFWKNRVNASVTATYGGAVNIFNSSTPVFTNCIFFDNYANYGGAIYNAGYRLYLWNSIIWGNAASEGQQIYTFNSPASSTTYLENCNIQGGISGAYGGYFYTPPSTNISSDPKWAGPDAGSFRLRDTSPCIDTGSNSAPNLPTVDFEGNSRIVDGNGDGTATIDMGVDEFIPGTVKFGVWYVNGSTAASGDGLSWAGSKKTIEEAVTAAQSGDQIWVRTGTYTPTSTIIIEKAISIYGGFVGTENSVLQRNITANTVTVNGLSAARTFDVWISGVLFDGITFTGSTFNPGMVRAFAAGTLITDCTFQGNAVGIYAGAGTIIRSCHFSENKSAIWVDGFTTTPVLIDGCTFFNNKNDSNNLHDGWGGGVYIHNQGKATITSSIFKSNSAVMGGAVAAYSGSTLTMANCIFGGDYAADGNAATSSGGAVHGPVIQATACTFRNNTAGANGGGLNGSQVTVNSGIFAGNSAGSGGGMSIGSGSNVTGVTFTGNSAASGQGGGALITGKANFTDCIFTGNTARWGGGLDGNGGIVNSIFSGNSAQYGGAAYWARQDLTSEIVHSIFYNNVASDNGGGFFSLYAISATNTIFLDNTANYDGIDIYNYYGYPMTISHCRITQDPFAGENGNITDPPQFVDPGAGNFHLQETSPCIDAGTLTPPGGLPSMDFAGITRPIDGHYNGVAKPDMGVYEFQPGPILPGDVNRSGQIDLADAIGALQHLSGQKTSNVFYPADINADGKIGLAEVIYILQKTAELRD